MKATVFGRDPVTPVSVGTRRDGNQLHVTVDLPRPLAPGGDSVEFDPPIKVVAGDTVHFEVRAEHRDPAAMVASFFRHEQAFPVREDSTITRLFGY